MSRLKEIIQNLKKQQTEIKDIILKSDTFTINEILNNSVYNLNKFDNNYKTALDYALIRKNPQIIKLLINKKAKLGTYLYQIKDEKHFLETINLLNNTNYDLNSFDLLGFAPIHHASSSGYTIALKKLIELKANISTKSYNGDSPIKIALKGHKTGVFIGTA